MNFCRHVYVGTNKKNFQMFLFQILATIQLQGLEVRSDAFTIYHRVWKYDTLLPPQLSQCVLRSPTQTVTLPLFTVGHER